ncbi:hypothetical protein TB2_035984 [Malus domestica]
MIRPKPTYYLCLTVKRENRVLQRKREEERGRGGQLSLQWSAEEAVAVSWRHESFLHLMQENQQLITIFFYIVTDCCGEDNFSN